MQINQFKLLYINKQYLMENYFAKIASISNLMEVADYLKDKPKLNITTLRDKFQSTLLHHCAFNNQFQKMKVLLKHLKTFYQNNQVVVSARYDISPFKSNSKAWINQSNNQGYTAIHYACLHGNVQMLMYLEELGANIFCKSNAGQSILHMACQNNQLKPLLYLYNKGLDFNQTNRQQQTLLHQASQRGFSEVVNYLVALPQIQLDRANSNGDTALILATKQNKTQVVKRLLIKGADVNINNLENKNCISIAKQKNYQKLTGILNQDYTCTEKLLIFCNKKIVYKPQDPTISYILLFLFLLITSVGSTHLFIKLDIIILAIVGIFYLLLFVVYITLLKKPQKFTQNSFNALVPPICAECRINQIPQSYHCFICKTCIYRYDHHCPWINGCIGFYNVGKFSLFLFLMIIGMLQITAVNLYFGYLKKQYNFDSILSMYIKYIIHGYNMILVIMFLVPLILLFSTQLKNLLTNETRYERAKARIQLQKKKKKKQSLLNQESSITNQEEQQEENKWKLKNCIAMCTQKPESQTE